MAARIFLATSSLLMSAIRRSGDWHLGQTSSNPKVLLSSSAHGVYQSVKYAQA